MEVVTDRQEGLFPQPGEISLRCSCPDWATMCKHVAAVLYGVGARLDSKPELLFLLRGVNHEELIEADTEQAVTAATSRGKSKRLAAAALGEVFGIEIDTAGADAASPAAQDGSKVTPTKPAPSRAKKLAARLPLPHASRQPSGRRRHRPSRAKKTRSKAAAPTRVKTAKRPQKKSAQSRAKKTRSKAAAPTSAETKKRAKKSPAAKVKKKPTVSRKAGSGRSSK